ncbi:MAG: PKD domain-containing protein [Bacteroidota bacterium]
MKKIILFTFVFIFTTLLFTPKLFSQISEGGTPISFLKHIQLVNNIPTEVMPWVDVPVLLQEDSINDQHKDIPWRFGYNIPVNLNLQNSGLWETIGKGNRIWRLKIVSTGALSINLTFDDYFLPEGAKLFIYNEDKTEVIGSFTNKNNKPFRELGTTLVHGDIIIVEYFEPGKVADQGSLSIGTVTHGYRDLFSYAKGLGDSGPCNNNVICPVGDSWRDQIRSVAIIIVGGSAACTGSLINNTCEDGTPYFLTANHCLGGSVSTWVFRFNWDSPICTPTQNGPTNQTISGATLRANNSGSDFGLIELSAVPPAGYNVFYSGWDNSGTNPTSQVAIHHPSGDVKKISFDYDPATQTTWNGAAVWEIGNWEDGTTEGGSSGSPLFDQNGRVIGQLYGGTASCSNITDDNYGRFNVSWDAGGSPSNQLVDWLDGCGTGATTVDGYDPNQPSVALDASINSILTPINGSTSCDLSFDPEVVLRNKGIDTLTQVDINYQVDNGTINTYYWTGILATNATDNITLPTQTLGSGSHSFTVFTSNPNSGTDLNTSNDTMTSNFDLINPVGITLPLTEGFENVTFPPSGWILDNPDMGDTWERDNSVSGFGNSTACMMIDNFDNDNTGASDYLITPYLDFSGVGSPLGLDFSVAYARYSNNYHDSLIVSVSTDCGNTWDRVYAKGNNVLSTTGADETNAFVPTNSQWRTDSINLDAYIGQSRIQIAIENKSGWGNNLYIDDINIYGNVIAEPVASFSASDTTICIGKSVTFTDQSVNYPTSWIWSFPGGTPSSDTVQNPTVTYDSVGTYDVILITANANGSDTLSKPGYITVSANPFGNFIATDTIGCSPLTINFTDISTGANSYLWDFGDGDTSMQQNPTHVFTNPSSIDTTYTICLIAINASGCSDTLCMNVSVYRNPAVSVLPLSAVICIGDTVNLSVSGASFYNWSPSAGLSDTTGSSINAYPGSTTSYTVTGIDTNACVDSAIVSVEVISGTPSAGFASDTTSGCGSLTVNFTNTSTNATGYAWAFTGGIPTSDTIPNPTVIYNSSGSNDVELIAYGCGINDTILLPGFITVYPYPVISITPSLAAICEGSSVNLTAYGANTYYWSPSTGLSATSGDSVTASPTGTVSYTVIGTDTNGCTNTTLVTVTVNPLPTITITPASPGICTIGDSIILTASGANTYSWSPSTGLNNTTGASVTASPTSNITYTVVGTDTNSCVNSNTVTVAIAPVIVSFVADNDTVDLAISGTVNFTDNTVGAVSWTWNFGDGNSDTIQNPGNTYDSVGTYTVQLTVSNGACSATDSLIITVINTNRIKEYNPANSFHLYPNPATGIVNLELSFNKPEDIKITVFNIIGEIVSITDLKNIASGIYNIDLSEKANGIYYFYVQTDVDMIVKKVSLIH